MIARSITVTAFLALAALVLVAATPSNGGSETEGAAASSAAWDALASDPVGGLVTGVASRFVGSVAYVASRAHKVIDGDDDPQPSTHNALRGQDPNALSNGMRLSSPRRGLQ